MPPNVGASALPRRFALSRTTRNLVESIFQGDAQGATLLDVGGRVGRLQRELYGRGVATVTHIAPSRGRLATTKAEAERRGYAGDFVEGEFTELYHTLQSADLVTLDRVTWSYPDIRELVSGAAARARKRIGLVVPRDAWWVRASIRLRNVGLRILRKTKKYAHRTADIHARIRRNGFRRIRQTRTLFWQIDVYERAPWGGV